MTGWLHIRSGDPTPHLERNGCAPLSDERLGLDIVSGRLQRMTSFPTSLCIVNPRYVVHTAGDKEDSVWRPGEVVYLGAE